MDYNIVVEDAVISLCYLAYFVAMYMYGVVCVKEVHSSWGGREGIFLTHFIIINKSEVPIILVVVIFFRGCLPEIVVPSYAVGFIYIPGKLCCANDQVHYSPIVVFVCLHITLLHYHYYADVTDF